MTAKAQKNKSTYDATISALSNPFSTGGKVDFEHYVHAAFFWCY